MINRADILKFKAMKTALIDGKAQIYINFKQLNRKNSPFFNPWENILPLLFVAVFSLVMMFSSGAISGILILLAGVISYIKVFPFFMQDIMKQRVLFYSINDINNWNKMWQFRGVTIKVASNPRIVCKSYEDDWRDFVVINFADLMIEKKVLTQSQEKPKELEAPAKLKMLTNESAKENRNEKQKAKAPKKNRAQPHFAPEDPDFYD
ncbi:MAG: hypothetical protein AB7U85_00885 [Alphaproteobacteria bacterium]